MHESNPNLDQHFLVDRDVAVQMTSLLDVQKNDVVLEIGPGKGALTKEIPKCKEIIVIEKDENLIPELKMIDGIQIIHGNALQKISRIKFTKLLSNTPYAIVEPLLRKMIFCDFEIAIISVGGGFAKHLKEENILSFLANSFFEIKEVGIIHKNSFFPKPRINSVILKIEKKVKLSKEDELVQNLYKQRDKILKNALREFFVGNHKITKNEAREKIKGMNLEENLLGKSVEQLTLEDLKKITKN